MSCERSGSLLRPSGSVLHTSAEILQICCGFRNYRKLAVPKPPRRRQNAKLTAGDRDQIAELVAQKMNPSANSESGRLLSVDQLIQLGVVQRVQTPKQNLLATLLKHSSNTTDPVALLQAVEKTSLFNN